MLHPEPYPYLEHIMYEYRFPNENRIERWPLDQARYPNSAESNSPPLVWESAGNIIRGVDKKKTVITGCEQKMDQLPNKFAPF